MIDEKLHSLKELKELLDSGVISEDEFNNLKAEIIAAENNITRNNSYSRISQCSNEPIDVNKINKIHLPLLLASNDEFWQRTLEFHRDNLNSYLRPFTNDKYSLQNAIFADVPSRKTFLNIFNNYPILKNEYLIAISDCGFCTNYRLVYCYTGNTIVSLPLYNIIEYKVEAHSGAKVKFIYKDQITEHRLDSYLFDYYISPYIETIKSLALSDEQKFLIENNYITLKQLIPNFAINYITLSSNLRIPSFLRKLIAFTLFVALIFGLISYCEYNYNKVKTEEINSINLDDTDNSSLSRCEYESKTCSWCNNSFEGKAYSHAAGQIFQYSSACNNGFCSRKCANESCASIGWKCI